MRLWWRVDYLLLCDDEGGRLLVAIDPAAAWIVVDEDDGGCRRVIDEELARGCSPYFRGVIDHPAWYLGWEPLDRVRVYRSGRSGPAELWDRPPGERQREPRLADPEVTCGRQGSDQRAGRDR